MHFKPLWNELYHPRKITKTPAAPKSAKSPIE